MDGIQKWNHEITKERKHEKGKLNFISDLLISSFCVSYSLCVFHPWPSSPVFLEQSMTGPLQIATIVSTLFEENCYIVHLRDQNKCLVIDPGLDPQDILQEISDQNLEVAAILNTHGHADHIAGNAALTQAFPTAPLVIGRDDAPLLTDANANLSAPFGMTILSPAADFTVSEGDVIDEAGIRLEVLEVPGHSPGHVVFVHRSEPTIVFGGDVLFRGSIGRTDFFNSRPDVFLDGIRKKMYTLPHDTIVYPGHGPVTTIGYERQTNPFVRDSE
jgi:glyoxylase-like metal-dependent hydrolase (beta-lactamase superfamily II)